MVTDPIADLLTRMRNAFNAKRDKTVVQSSKIKIAILTVLKKHQFIADFYEIKTGGHSELEIIFNPERRTLNLKRISKPGQRIYVPSKKIQTVLNSYGVALFSTSKGVMTGEEARKARVGGEYLCEAW